MISKETFVDVMNKLKVLDEKMNNVDVAMKELSPDFSGFYIPQILNIALEILRDVFDDNDDWISYFMFELNWLHYYKTGCVSINGESIDLSTWDKVYEFLINNMNNKHN